MELNLIPFCNSHDHIMEDSDYLLDREINCDICNKDIAYYRCKNCEYVTCIDCQKKIEDENDKIINGMKKKLENELSLIQKEVGNEYEIIFYKETGNIYIHDPIKKSTKRYLHECRFKKCLNNIF